MPTVTALALDLGTEAGESTNDTEYLALVRKWIKGGYREIGDASAWSFLKVDELLSLSVLGGKEYNTQASCSEITVMRFTGTDEQIVYVPVERLIALNYDLELPGKPQFFYASGFDVAAGRHQFTVWPVPDATYAIEIHENGIATTLADGDTIPMPDNFLTILEDYVRMMQAKDDKDYELYDRMDNKWRSALSERLKRYSKQPSRLIRMKVSDIGAFKGDLTPARLDPNHFQN